MLSACNIRGISMLKIVVDVVVASWEQEQLVKGSSSQVHDDAVAMEPFLQVSALPDNE